jgi:hypothetical protein
MPRYLFAFYPRLFKENAVMREAGNLLRGQEMESVISLKYSQKPAAWHYPESLESCLLGIS